MGRKWSSVAAENVEKFDKNEMVTNSATNSDEVFIIIQQIRQKFRQNAKKMGRKCRKKNCRKRFEL